MATSLATLLVQATKDAMYSTFLSVASSLGLPVSSWQAGDPTRSLYHIEAETLSTLEGVVAGFISSGFLDYAHGTWLEILAKQVFNVDVPPATYATCDVVLTNGGGGIYDLNPGDVTLKSTASGKTFRITTGGHLSALPATLTVTVVADEAGAASSAGAGEINDFVTALLGVTCSNAIAAVGVDKQSEATTIQQCRDKLGSFSPNGPKEAYSYVARNPTLSGTSAVTRVRVYSDSTTGNVTMYLAGAGGGVAEADRVLVAAAIAKWATSLCITPTVIAATGVAVAITYELWVYKSSNKTAAQISADVLTALQTLFSTRPIGGDIITPGGTGQLYKSMIESTIRAVYSQAFRVVVTSPAADTPITSGQVATLGVVSPTIDLIVDP